jgi:hypothetical protein
MIGRNSKPVGKGIRKRFGVVVRISIGAGEGARHGLDDTGEGTVGALVRGQLDDLVKSDSHLAGEILDWATRDVSG